MKPTITFAALALALNTGLRGRAVLRGLFLLPWVIPGVVVSFVWLWIFNANYGVMNALLQALGLIDEPQAWLAQPGTAMLAVIIAKTWQSFPWMMVMLLAGLQTVPRELHEAAEIDGAGTVRRFFAIPRTVSESELRRIVRTSPMVMAWTMRWPSRKTFASRILLWSVRVPAGSTRPLA